MPTPQVLNAFRVLELGQHISAAYCSRLLADYGAQVIKVEPPDGDTTRQHGPFPGDQPDPESSGLFTALNTNKHGVTLNISHPSGAATIKEIVPYLDILVENYPKEAMERWGLSYTELSKLNPQLVMASITPFGHDGPYNGYKAYAINTSASGGAAHRIGHPERYPLAMPYDRADYWGGLNAAAAVMLAVMARRQTGNGQHVDISTVECINTFGNGTDTINYADSGAVTSRRGIHAHIAYPYVILPCKDGHIALIIGNNRHWQRLIDLMGNPPWSKNPRYQDRVAMGFYYPDEVDALLKPWLAHYTKEEIWEMFRERGIPWHPVQTINSVLKWEQLEVRNYWQQVPDGNGRIWTLPGAPFKMGKTPANPRQPAPKLGEHNKSIFQNLLGWGQEKLDRLRDIGVI